MIITETRPPDLVSPELFVKLVNRVVTDENLDRERATRIVYEMLAFLECCALNPAARLVPSKAVDAGWHAFILHTRDYAEFCDRVAGWFIHHEPTADATDDGSPVDTVAIMRASGLEVDEDLWASETRCRQDCQSDPNPKCHQCHAGCHDSP